MEKNDLSLLPNIGKILAQKLSEVEINSEEELKIVGSEGAFVRLKTLDKEACIDQLFALEGAIQGVRWHNLSEEKKNELKIFYKMCQVTN